MARRKSRSRLTPGQVAKAKTSYEAGVTFLELAQQHGVSEGHVRKKLHEAGVVARARGKPPAELPAELIAADRRAGLSTRQIAAKHGLPDHKPVAALLRRLGFDVRARPGKSKIPGVVLGRAVTNRQAFLRRRPPMVIPPRTHEDRLRYRRWFTPREAGAIDYEIRAGRYQVIPPGRRGIPTGLEFVQMRIRMWLANQPEQREPEQQRVREKHRQAQLKAAA